jgi:hypothetical protein
MLGPAPGGPLSTYLERGGEIDWIIGVDAVTTDDSLRVLNGLEQNHANCRIRVFLSTDGTLFHPKFYLFERRSGHGVLLAGSNNLTAGGLESNIEFASRVEIARADFKAYKQIFDAISQSTENLHEINPQILQKAASNRRRAARMVVSELESGQVGTPDAIALSAVFTDGELNTRVLIRAMPESGHRPSQFGVPAEAMGEFFGLASKGSTIRLQQMLTSGELEPIEPPRPLVLSEKNLNRRIEVEGLKRIPHSGGGHRPVLIFQEVIPFDLYRYLILVSGDQGHAEIASYLNALPTTRNQMPWKILTVGELVTIWPDYPV